MRFQSINESTVLSNNSPSWRVTYDGLEVDLEYRAHQVPQCQELIAAYRAQYQLETITPPPCNKRKHPASKDGNPLGSNTAPKDGSPLESEPAIRQRPYNKRKHPASKDGSPLESGPAIRKRKSKSGSNKEKNNPKRRK